MLSTPPSPSLRRGSTLHHTRAPDPFQCDSPSFSPVQSSQTPSPWSASTTNWSFTTSFLSSSDTATPTKPGNPKEPLVALLREAGDYGFPAEEHEKFLEEAIVTLPSSKRMAFLDSPNPFLRSVARAGEGGLSLQDYSYFQHKCTRCCNRVRYFINHDEHYASKDIHYFRDPDGDLVE